MIDCGRTENYLKYRKEICDKHSTCVGCPLIHNEGDINEACYIFEDRNFEKAVEAVQKWVDENINDDTSDPVNKPAHYTAGGVECIEAIKASMTDEEFRGFLKGQVIKYVWRYRLKDNPLQDLHKARYYLDRLRIIHIERELAKNENKVQVAE